MRTRILACWLTARFASALFATEPATPSLDLLARPLESARPFAWKQFSEVSTTRLSDVWQLRDGVLVCRGTPQGYLYLDHEFTNFILRLEWRWPEGKKPGNGGVLFRLTGPDKIWPRSLEAQINAGQAGDFWGLDGFGLDGPAVRKKTLDHPQLGKLTNLKRTADLEKPAGQWNQYEIIARGPNVILRLNGEEVNRATSCDVIAGRICLTAEGDEIHFRNVSLRELPATAAEPASQRLKRSESFLGIHFDFHAGPDCTEIGKNTTREMIENIINQVHPDYLQIDCKGHRGLSSYPTKVGNPAPGFVGDPLRLWRQVTAERGVSLYMHYSGVWDSEAILQHPDWGAVNADGKTNGNATSFFSPYADQLLIPQLRELAGEYGVDGAWIDGECWASVPDYGAAALRAFRNATGIQEVPRKPGQPGWFEFLQFNREQFRRYLRHYIAEVKKTNPRFELCSNWAFTDHMPEPVCAPVDFLSGDYSPEDSVNSARLSARYLMRQGKPWDLMAWSFTRKPGKDGTHQKTAVQLQREAAVVVALGGGFQAYFKQKRDGSIFDEQMPVMGEVAKFCRPRQALCHRAEAVPQVALLFSTAAHYRRINGLFSRDPARLSGVLQALLEGQQSVEILGEHHLAGRMTEYPLIVVPEWEYLDAKFKADLIAYVKGGGNLLLIGPKTAALFESELGVTLQGEVKPDGPIQLTQGSLRAVTKGRTQAVKLSTKAEPFGELHAANDTSSPAQPAASITKLGRGKIAATYFTFGQGYLNARTEMARDFLNDLVRQLFPTPMVEVAGSHDVDVSVARNQGRLLVNLVNTAGPHRSEPILESIPPVGPLVVTIRQATKPDKVTLEPAGTPLAFEFAQGKVRLTVPRLKIHEVVVVDSK